MKKRVMKTGGLTIKSKPQAIKLSRKVEKDYARLQKHLSELVPLIQNRVRKTDYEMLLDELMEIPKHRQLVHGFIAYGIWVAFGV